MRDSAQREDRRETPHRISAAAEAEQKYSVAGLRHPQNRSVAVDDVFRDAEPRRLACDIVEPPAGAVHKQETALRLRAEAGIVEGQLFPRINGRLGPAARRTVKFVNIADVLVGREPAGLAGPVRKDDDAFSAWHWSFTAARAA